MSDLNKILTPELENLIDEKIKYGIIKYLEDIRLKRRIKIKEIIKLNHELTEKFPLETDVEILNLHGLEDKELIELDEITQNQKWRLEYLKLRYRKIELIQQLEEVNIIVDLENDVEFRKFNTELSKMDMIKTTKEIIKILEDKLENAINEESNENITQNNSWCILM
jgi:hypothetical protein